ncbi:MAG: hypothetical protein C0483_09680 [Pirellula sp.]|nr:hypothetical protein [Pirellula sp.]
MIARSRSELAKSKKARRIEREPQLEVAPPRAEAWRRLAERLHLRSLGVLLLLGVVGYYTYRESLYGRFFFDDILAIEQNPHVFILVEPSTRWRWSTWKYAASAEQDTPFAGRPVVALSFALNHWWATVMSPAGIADFHGLLPLHYPYFHYVNLGLHVLSAALLYALIRRTLSAPVFGDRFQTTAFSWAALGALVWLVHPLNTETVVYVTQRTEQLMSVFLLLTLYSSSRGSDAGERRQRVAWQSLAVVCCALGMASKENMIAAPLLVAAYDRAFRYSSWRDMFRERGWFYGCLAATWSILSAIMLAAPRGSSVGFDHRQFPWYDYLITQCWCLGRYVFLSLVPLGNKLCVDYGRTPVLDPEHVVPGALMIAAALATTVWGWLRRPWVGFVGTWFFFILAPTSSFVPIVTEIGAERRMYLPLVAVLVAAAALAAAAWSALRASPASAERSTPRRRFTWQTATLFLIGVGAVVGLARTSHERNKVFLDDLTLYRHIVDVFPNNERGVSNYGKILLDRGAFDEGLKLFNRAVMLDPQFSDAFSNRSVARFRQRQGKRLDLAISDSTEAICWNRFDVNALNNRGQAFYDAGLFDLARADFSRVIEIMRGRTDAYISRANVDMAIAPKDPVLMASALDDIAAALRYNPYSFRAYMLQGTILNNLDRPAEAVAALESCFTNFRREATTLAHSAETAPALAAAERVLAEVDERRVPLAPAITAALERFPYRSRLAQILNERARAYRLLGEQRKDARAIHMALDDLCRAIVFDPLNIALHLERAELYGNMKRYGEAFFDYQQALKMEPDNREALLARGQLAVRLRDYATAWQDAKRLRDLGTPLDDATLANLRQLSGGDYPTP